MQNLRVLVACEESGVVRDAFIAQGHDAMSCDLLPSRESGPHYQGDLFDVIDYPWDLALFFIPCTNTSVSGAKHFKEKWSDGRQAASVSLFMKSVRRSEHIPHVAWEHPVSIISTLWRKPDQIIQPWQHGHGETKQTCIWLKGLPKLEPTEIVGGREQRVWKMGPGPDRARLRSETFPGIASAMADQWGHAIITAQEIQDVPEARQ